MKSNREYTPSSLELESYQSANKKICVKKTQSLTEQDEYNFYRAITAKFDHVNESQPLINKVQLSLDIATGSVKAFLESVISGDLKQTKKFWNELYNGSKNVFYSARENALLLATLHNRADILNFLVSKVTLVILAKAITNNELQEIYNGTHVFGTIHNSIFTLYFRDSDNNFMSTMIDLGNNNNKHIKQQLNGYKESIGKDGYSLEIDIGNMNSYSHIIEKLLKHIRNLIINAGGDASGLICEKLPNNLYFGEFLQILFFIMAKNIDNRITQFWLSQMQYHYSRTKGFHNPEHNQLLDRVNQLFILLASHGDLERVKFICANQNLNKWIDDSTLIEAYCISITRKHPDITKLFLMNALFENKLDLFIELRKSMLNNNSPLYSSEQIVENILFSLCIKHADDEKLSGKAKMLLFACSFSFRKHQFSIHPFTPTCKNNLLQEQLDYACKPDGVGKILNRWLKQQHARGYPLTRDQTESITYSILFKTPQLLEEMTICQWKEYFPELANELAVGYIQDENLKRLFVEAMTKSLWQKMVDKLFDAQFFLLIQNIAVGIVSFKILHANFPRDVSLIIYSNLVDVIFNDKNTIIPSDKKNCFSPRLFAAANQNVNNEVMKMDVEAASFVRR